MNPHGSQRADLQKRAYSVLNAFFQTHVNEVVEVEILPPGFEPLDGILIQDGLAVGIPKKVLALAFVEARQRFFAGVKVDELNSKSALEASIIILFFDPEHITAANFRKRRLLALRANTSTVKGVGGRDSYITALDQELSFLNSILTSPLHRQSKSPTLWHHRAWLLHLLLPIKLAQQPKTLLFTYIEAELTAVCKSGEQHPKNYYAWQYARRLFAKVCAVYFNGAKSDHDYHESLVNSAHIVTSWCVKHPSDISGWSFLLYLLPMLDSVAKRREIVNRVIDYAAKLGIENESVWVFLRLALADGSILQDERNNVVQKLYDCRDGVQSMGEQSPFQIRVLETLNWIETYNNPVPTPNPDPNP